MEDAIKIAEKTEKDIPIGAVLVKNGEILCAFHNEKELQNDTTAHAEILCIRKANEILHDWRLEDCSLYVTLEPCPMCACAIIDSRIKEVFFGAYDNFYGALGSKFDLREIKNSKLKVTGGILEKKCQNIIDNFFDKVRK